MADLAQLQDALINADRAGDTAAAQTLADEIYRMQSQPVQSNQPSFSQIPLDSGAGQRMADESAMRAPRQAPGIMDKLAGAGEAGLTLLSGATTGALGYIGGAIGGVAGQIANGEFGTEQGMRRAADAAQAGAAQLTYAPRTEVGREYAGNVGEAINDSGIAGLPIGAELSAAGQLARPAARQAANALGTEAYIARKLADKAANVKLTPGIERERAELASKAANMGIEAPLHTLTDNKYLRMTGEFFDNLPLSGSAKKDNNIAFQRSVIDQIGGNAKKFEKLTPAVFSEALAKSGSQIGKTFAKITVPYADEALQSDLAALRGTLPRSLSEVERVLVGNMDELARLAKNNKGMIPGKAIKELHSEVLGELRKPAVDNVAGLRERMSDFQAILEDAADRQITNPADKQAYQTARMQYAKAKTLEPLVARGGINGVSPQALLQQLNSNAVGKHRVATGAAGELGDLAQIAQNFMKEQGSSGTAERGAVMGAVTSIKGAVGAATGITLGNAYNRIARPVARRAVQNSLDDGSFPPVNFGQQALTLAEESPWQRPAAPVAEAPYNGLLTAEQAPISDPMRPAQQFATRQDVPSVDFPLLEGNRLPIQRSGERAPMADNQGMSLAADNGIDFYGNAPAMPAQPIADRGLMALAEPGDITGPFSGTAPAERMTMRSDYPTIDFPLRQEVLQQPEISAAVTAYRAEAARLEQIANNAISQPVRAKAFQDLTRLQEQFAAGMRQLGIRSPQEAIGLQPLYEQSPVTRLPIQQTFDARQRVNAERQRLQLQRLGEAQTVDEAIQAVSGQ